MNLFRAECMITKSEHTMSLSAKAESAVVLLPLLTTTSSMHKGASAHALFVQRHSDALASYSVHPKGLWYAHAKVSSYLKSTSCSRSDAGA